MQFLNVDLVERSHIPLAVKLTTLQINRIFENIISYRDTAAAADNIFHEVLMTISLVKVKQTDRKTNFYVSNSKL